MKWINLVVTSVVILVLFILTSFYGGTDISNFATGVLWGVVATLINQLNKDDSGKSGNPFVLLVFIAVIMAWVAFSDTVKCIFDLSCSW